jgi:phosphatidylglycerol lysyltransferase
MNTSSGNLVKNTNAAQFLLENYGKDSLSYFAFHESKHFFFSSTGKSFLSYIIEGKIALVTGDPIGPVSDIPLLLQEFTYFVKGAELKSCFLGVTYETLQLLSEIGHKHLYLGKEAVITLSRFSKNELKKKVRRAERAILNKGIVCRIYNRRDIPHQYLQQLHIIAKEWLKQKGDKEKRLTMTLGRIPRSDDPDCKIVLALHDDRVVGYLTFVPVYASNSLSLDASRRYTNAPNGLIEFLLLQSLEQFKLLGIQTVSLNFATFHFSKEEMYRSVKKLLLAQFYHFLSVIYKTNSLYTFNNKFLPNWKDRYIVFEKKRYLPKYLFAIAKTEL